MCALTVYKQYGIQQCEQALLTKNMETHNVHTHCLRTIWNPTM
jgi:hypothetical protein